MTAPRILTQPLGGSPLARDIVARRVPASWTPEPPNTSAGWRQRLAGVRDALGSGDWLDAIRPAIAPTGAAAARLARSSQGRGVVVTTGQQPGLFGGPLYSWHKALSALALADVLEAQTGVPVAPVFWAATDDADLAEASTTYVAVPGGVREITVGSGRRPGATAARPLREVALGDVSAQIDVLRQGSGSAAFVDALEAVSECYDAGATVGGAFVCLTRRLLEPLGVAVLDAGHPSVRAAAVPVLQAALREAVAIDAALLARDAELRRAGYEPQVSHVPGLSLVFRDADGRQRVPITEAAADGIAPLGPNVLLRPIVERAILPTAAYLAGPAELAYFTQTSAVAQVMGVAQPLALPRWSATILEPHVARILDRYDVRLEELRDPHRVETRLAAERLPESFRRAMARLRDTTAEATEDLPSDAPHVGQRILPAAVLAGFRRDVEHRIGRLERRARAALKRADGHLVHDIGTARGSLFPNGAPQERRLNLMPLLARYGPALMDALRASARSYALGLSHGEESVALAARASSAPVQTASPTPHGRA